MSPNQELLDKDLLIRVEEFRHLAPDIPAKNSPHRALLLAAFGVVSSIYIVLRLWHIGTYSLWCDEAFSVFVAKSQWRELFRQVVIDRVHPPLFYMLLKLWIGVIGASLARLRLFSVLFSVLTLIPLWNCMKQVRLSMELRIALLLAIACNPFLIFYSQEVRMYSLLCFLSVWSLDLYLKQKSGAPSVRALWAVVNLTLVMVHVAGVAVVGCELAHAALARREFRNRFVACLPALIAFTSWVIAVRIFSPAPARVLHNVEWIARLTPTIEWKTISHLLGSSLGALVLNVPVALAIWANRKLDRRYATLFFLLSVVVIASVFTVSVIVKPVWQERYLIVAVIPYYLLAGDSIRRISPKWALRCTLAIVVVGMVSLEYDLTHHPDRPVFTSFTAPVGEPLFASDDLAGAPLAIRQHLGDAPIRVVKASSPANSGLKLTLRDVSYSIGEREYLIQGGNDVFEKDFLYAFDIDLDPMSPPGLLPSNLASYGCAGTQLASTHGEGRQYVLLRVKCM